MRQRFLPVLLLSTLLGCSKSDSNPIIDFGEGEGITYRSANNLPVGPQDPTDWTSDAVWNKQERALFPEFSFDLNGSQQPNLVFCTPTYPNPSVGWAHWTAYSPRPTSGPTTTYSVRAVLVNRKYQTVLRLGPADFNSGNTGITFNLDYIGAGVSTNELYRLYYVMYNANGLVYKGHGDIRYSPL
ncbi:MAG: hypothetical protein M3Y54_12320 [Bacteroidota bacterium]|nr:hypothetical protein [Bacteroidota bacterium]